jgi:hypothetical protein
MRSGKARGGVNIDPAIVDGNHRDSRSNPRTLKEVDLGGRVRAAGGSNLKEAGEFFGWKPSRVIKGVGDFTKDELFLRGWSKERLLDVAEGYEPIARITPDNPSAAGRAAQLREIATLFDR